MKIVIVEFAGKGAMAHYVFQLARGLASAGADVTYITERNFELANLPRNFVLEQSIDLWDAIPAGPQSNTPWAIAGRKVRRGFRAFRHYGQWLRVIRRVAELKPDVVQLGDLRFTSELFPLLLLRRKVPFMADVCHNIHPYATGGKSVGSFDRSRFTRFFYRRIYALFDIVFVHFERNRAEFRDTFGIPDEHLGVTVHGNEEIFAEIADPNVDAAVIRRRLGIGPNDKVVLFFGRLSRYKGIDILLNVFPRVHRETGARLLLAGAPFHGFDVDDHRRLTERLGIGDAVIWSPQYVKSEEIAAWMKVASVMVLPYRDISQSGALHVGQTFGVPLVASAVGAMQDVIEDGVSGLLVPPDDEKALGDAIIRLLNDPQLAASIGAHAAADAHGRFSWRTIGETILGKYRERLRRI